MNALKLLTLAACMGTVQKTVPSMHEPQHLFLAIFITILNETCREVLKSLTVYM